MKSPRVVVVDTNVLVAGLLTADASSPTARVLDGMISARFEFLLSETLLAEYRRVLLRPAIRARLDLDDAEIDELLVTVVQNGIVREPGRTVERAPDRGDQHLFDLAATESGAWIVTGDRLLLERESSRIPIASPRELVEARG